MKSVVKLLGYLVAILIVLTVLTISFLVLFVSPNKFKPFITAQVMKSTGRNLTIDGNLSWSFYPNLGIRTGHMLLTNPEGFSSSTFAEIDEAIISLKLLPLLRSKIESDTLTLVGLRLHLIKDKAGKTNWSFVAGTPGKQNSENNAPTETGQKQKKFVFHLENVNVSKASLSYQDEQAHQEINVSQLELRAEHITDNSYFPIAASFNYAVKNPAISGQLSLSSEVALNINSANLLLNNFALQISMKQAEQALSLGLQANVNADLSKQYFTLDNVNTEVHGLLHKQSPLHLKGKLIIDVPNELLSFNNFTLNWTNLKLQGNVQLSQFNTLRAFEGDVAVAPFDVQAFMQSIGQPLPSIQVTRNFSAALHFKGKLPATQAMNISNVAAAGEMNLGELIAQKVKLQNIKIKLHLAQGLLDLNSITATLYDGTLAGNAKVNLANPALPLSVDAKIANVKSEQLFAEFAEANTRLKLNGLANLSAQLATKGKDAQTVLANLSGKLTFSFLNGVLDGININHYVQSATAMINKESMSGDFGNSTEFGNLTGTATIQNGIANNNDLLIDSPAFVTKGQGKIDLVKSEINYELKVVSKKAAEDRAKNISNLYNLTIPLQLSGALTHPTVTLDAQSLAKQIAEQQLKNAGEKVQDQVKDKLREELKDKLPENIKDKLPGKAGELLENFLGH